MSVSDVPNLVISLARAGVPLLGNPSDALNAELNHSRFLTRAGVLVLEIVGVLPNIDAEEGYKVGAAEGEGVLHGLGFEV